ncbi:hypothetical protein F5884DRAFT_627218, partial [Xylogone sp. PMI_703]
SNFILEYRFELGELADDAERFCLWHTVKKYPYDFVGTANRDKVSQRFFEEAKVYERGWDFLGPIILVPTEQFEHFLEVINNELGTALKIPDGGARPRFEIVFDDEGIPRPRYLGRATNREDFYSLKFHIPHRAFGAECSGDIYLKEPTGTALELFRAKMNLITKAPQPRKSKQEKKEAARIRKQKSLRHTVEKVRKHLGLLKKEHDLEPDIEDHTYKPASFTFDPSGVTPYEQESVIFICVDVEAWEHNRSIITEVGIATLDTEDLKSIPPGENASNWRNFIRARHFRISEHKHYNNSQYVSGCADRFMFGESEFIELSKAPHIVSTCFKYPYSRADEDAPEDAEENQKRNIVLVGHDVAADVDYLKRLGYSVTNLSNLTEIIDTAKMWQYHKNETQPRSLSLVLADIGIPGWNLHNAGNDAVYTLQAMLGIA